MDPGQVREFRTRRRRIQAFLWCRQKGGTLLLILAVVEMLVILAFVLGLYKGFSYAAVLVFHAVSTPSSYRQYLDLWAGSHLLFFAA